MLKGTLDDFTLPDVFRLMSFAKKTGRLDVLRSAGQGSVFFREGEVYFAKSSLSKEPLGQKLVRARALTEGQLMKALDEQAASGERLGTLLLNSGLVTEDQLEGALRQQIEDSIFDLLRWELGEFAWEPSVEVDVEVRIAVSVENLIMEASRRLDELEVIKRKIPSGIAVLGMAATPPEGAVEINITPEEWRILVLVDGSRTVNDIAGMVGLDEFGAMRVLYGLVSAGLIELISDGLPADHDASVTKGPEPKTISQADVVFDEPPAPVDSGSPAVAVVDPAPVAEVLVEETHSEPEPAEASAPEPVALEEAPAPEPPAPAEPAAAPADPFSETEDPFAAITEELQADSVEPQGTETTDVEADLVSPFGSLTAPESEATLDSSEALSALLDLEDEPFTEPVPAAEASASDEAPAIADEADPLAAEADWNAPVGIESFDAPQPDELVTQTPESSSFIDDLFTEPTTPHVAEEPPAPPAPAQDIPVSSAPSGDRPLVDRAAAVRELAGLFDDDDRPRARPSAPRPSEGGEPDTRKRVEDDEQVTKSIISRLIDGVKGL